MHETRAKRESEQASAGESMEPDAAPMGAVGSRSPRGREAG